MTWSDERVELLKKLYADGMSCSRIAAELGGVTRNAVIGKIHRLGLDGRPRPPSTGKVGRPRVRKPKPEPRPKITLNQQMVRRAQELAAYAADPEQIAPDQSPFACTLIELTDERCCYPMGDPQHESFRYCGAPRLSTTPYCGRHARVAAYSRTVSREKSEQPI